MLFGVLNDLDKYTLIPVISKLLLIFILDNLSFSKKIKLKLGIGIFSFIFSNMLYIILEKSCNVDNTNTLNLTLKTVFDSFIQYGGAFVIPSLLSLVPILGTVITVLTNLPFIGNLIDLALWVMGYKLARWGIKKFDSSDNFCKGNMGKMKKRIGIISIIIVLFIELKDLIF